MEKPPFLESRKSGEPKESRDCYCRDLEGGFDPDRCSKCMVQKHRVNRPYGPRIPDPKSPDSESGLPG